MKKSNKLSLFYVLSSVMLFATIVFGGIYGIYISVGLNFMRSSLPNINTASNINSASEISNVSFGGTVDFNPSMSGVIILSIILIVLSIFDFISLIKQIVFFKQYKLINESKFEKNIEKKVKSKSSVVFFAVVIDIVSFVVGIVGLFVNNRSFLGAKNISWILYLIDGLVSLFALISLVLLIKKLKDNKKLTTSKKGKKNVEKKLGKNDMGFKVDDIEYQLIKLKSMRSAKIISEQEYQKLRKKIISGENNIILNKED